MKMHTASTKTRSSKSSMPARTITIMYSVARAILSPDSLSRFVSVVVVVVVVVRPLWREGHAPMRVARPAHFVHSNHAREWLHQNAFPKLSLLLGLLLS